MRPVRHVLPMKREEQRNERKFARLIEQLDEDQLNEVLHIMIDLLGEEMKKKGSQD